MENELYNLQATARKTGVPVKWLKAKAQAGQVPCLKVNRRLLFNIEAVKKRTTVFEITNPMPLMKGETIETIQQRQPRTVPDDYFDGMSTEPKGKE